MSSFVLIHKKGENNRKAFVLNFKFRASHTVETMSLLQGINKKKREIKRKIHKQSVLKMNIGRAFINGEINETKETNWIKSNRQKMLAQKISVQIFSFPAN